MNMFVDYFHDTVEIINLLRKIQIIIFVFEL